MISPLLQRDGVVHMRAVVIGGSVAGLAAAVGLARRGWQVDVIERDPAPDTDSCDEAFVSWNRPGVPQFRQPHGFSARSRTLLLEHIPEVVDRLLADGIPELNFFKELAPPELWEDGDEAFTGLVEPPSRLRARHPARRRGRAGRQPVLPGVRGGIDLRRVRG